MTQTLTEDAPKPIRAGEEVDVGKLGAYLDAEFGGQLVGVGEHHARVDDDRRVGPREREHVHPELAEAAERHHFEHLKQPEIHRRTRRSWRNVFVRGEPLPRLVQAAGRA